MAGVDPDLVYLTSDSHFSHRMICEYANRPFSSVEEMNEKLIENWNRVVPKNGVVYHLGDIFLCNQQGALKIRARLNGTINLIVGNHDKTATSSIGHKMFGWIKDYYRLKVIEPENERGLQDIILFHYPIASWEKKKYLSYMAHGHSHSTYTSPNPKDLCLDVGVDNVAKLFYDGPNGERNKEDYQPISYNLLKLLMRGKLNDQ